MQLVPTAELESVKLSLVEQVTQQLFTIHRTNPSRFKPESEHGVMGPVSLKPRAGNTELGFLSRLLFPINVKQAELSFCGVHYFLIAASGFRFSTIVRKEASG
jgi:hypothetical protein